MMSDSEFVTKVKEISDKSPLDLETRKEYGLLVCAACETDERQELIEEYMQKDDVTLEKLFKYVLSLLPDVEIVDDDE